MSELFAQGAVAPPQQPPGVIDLFFNQLTASNWLNAGLILVALLGWLITYGISRRKLRVEYQASKSLQKKQAALDLIQDHIFDSNRVTSSQRVFWILNHERNFPWGDLVEDHLAGKNLPVDGKRTREQEDNEDLIHKFFSILNYYEFLSIAILTKTAEEEIIKCYFRGSFETIYPASKKVADLIRTWAKNNRIWISFHKVAENWNDDKPPHEIS